MGIKGSFSHGGDLQYLALAFEAIEKIRSKSPFSDDDSIGLSGKDRNDENVVDLLEFFPTITGNMRGRLCGPSSSANIASAAECYYWLMALLSCILHACHTDFRSSTLNGSCLSPHIADAIRPRRSGLNNFSAHSTVSFEYL